MAALKPTVRMVVERALALQLITDRGWSDRSIQKDAWLKRRRTKRFRKKVLKWDSEVRVSSYLSPAERAIWDAAFGTLSEEQVGYCTWQLESLVPLLWAIGIRPEMPEYSHPAKDNHYPLLHFGEPSPVDRVLAETGLSADSTELGRKSERLRLLANAYLVCHWRSRHTLLGNKGSLDLREEAPRVLGKQVAPALESLPLYRNGDLVSERHRLHFAELYEHQVQELDKLFAARLRALEWLVGDVTHWDDVAVRT